MKIEVFHNTIKSSLWGLLSKLFTLLCAFAVRTVIIYKLGTEYVGLDGLFSSILTLLNLSELGLGAAIVFRMYSCIVAEDYQTINQLLYLYKKAYAIIAVIIGVIGCVISFFIKTLIHGDIPDGINVYILYFLFLANTVSGYLFAAYRTALFTAFQRNDLKAKVQLFSDFIMYGLQIVVLIVCNNYYYYAGVVLLIIIPRNFLYTYLSHKHFPGLNPTNMPPRSITNDLYNRVVPLIGHKVGGAFLVSIDSIIISAFLGLKTLGLYNNYYYIITAIIGITSIIQQALVAGIGNKIITLSDVNVYRLYIKISFAWRWLIGCCAICFACLAQPFITIWIGKRHLMPTYIVVAMSFYYYLWQFRIIGMTFKDAAGLWKNDWFKPYVGMFINSILSAVLVYLTKNLLFVLIPTCFVFAFLYFPVETYVISHNVLHVHPWLIIKKNVLHTLLICLVGILTFFICSRIVGDSFGGFVCRALISVTFPNMVFYLILHKTEAFQMIMPYIKKMFHN